MEDSRICSCSECQENFLSNKHSQKWELSLKLEVTAEFQRREFHKFLGILGKAESIHSKLKALNIFKYIPEVCIIGRAYIQSAVKWLTHSQPECSRSNLYINQQPSFWEHSTSTELCGCVLASWLALAIG